MNNRESYHTCIDILRETEQYNFDILYIITKKEPVSYTHLKQVQRYIRLTKLVEPLRDMVDGLREDKIKIAFNPAVEPVSYTHLTIALKNIKT